MASEINHYIGGKLIVGRSGRKSPVFNPATGEQTGELSLASKVEVNEAVAAARAAAQSWGDMPSLRRARILNRFLRIAEDRIDELAQLITAEHGKTLSDAKGEIQRGLEVVEFAVGAPQLLKGEVSENVGTRVDSYGVRQPLGVVAGIGDYQIAPEIYIGPVRQSERFAASIRAPNSPTPGSFELSGIDRQRAQGF